MSLPGPDGRLRAAQALVFVGDLARPVCAPEDAHHLLDVLRLTDGAEVVAADGAGRFRACRLALDVGSARARRSRDAALRVVGDVVEAPPPPWPVTVAFGMPKGDRAEWAVQKLTELGVDRIVPLLTERTVVRLDDATAARRLERLRRVAREAAAQARRPRLPRVETPCALPAFLAEEATNAPGAGSCCPPVVAEPGGGPLDGRARCVIVGPEGGFAPEELSLAGARVGLGDAVLRAETAAVVAGALLAAIRSGALIAPASD